VIDSHTHLDSCTPPNDELVRAAAEAGVRRILTVGMDGASCRTALAEIEALAAHDRCVAIGETGLDYYRDRAPRADQERAFHAQIELARATGKPLVIHTRAAEDDTIDTLRARADGVTVIMHCFSMPGRLDECLAEGWWISFAGNVTYPKAQDLAAAAEQVPEDRLLVETDAPYLTPQVVRKHPNEPAYVAHTARFVAERRGLAYEELERTVERNAAGLFGW
jgi:TatD DNase family protein